MNILLSIDGRPGDSPEVGWTNVLEYQLDTSNAEDTIEFVGRAAGVLTRAASEGFSNDYDYAEFRAKVEANMLGFISDVMEQINYREVFRYEITDSYCHVTQIMLHAL